MRISRIFIDATLISGKTLTVDDETAHYIGRVLRMKSGDALTVFNARDGEFEAVVSSAGRKDMELLLGKALAPNTESPLHIHLGLGLSRGERMDYAVQKSTELGVAGITPLFTEYCEVKLDESRSKNKLQHWSRIAINACEQCGRTCPPFIGKPTTLESWLGANPGGILLDQRGSASLKQIKVFKNINVVIGPEGGFSARELELAGQASYSVVKLGPRILRSETAPVTVLSLLQLLHGDF